MNTEMEESLQSLGKALLPRAVELKRRNGERIPKWLEYSSFTDAADPAHVLPTPETQMSNVLKGI